jgi:hypothetical protein
VAGQAIPVTQLAAGTQCTYAINPSSFNNVPALGGNITVTITATAGCSWSVSGAPGWITASNSTGSGSGTTVITVLANLGAARNATFQIAGKNFSVAQLAVVSCTYTLNPTSFNLSNGAQTKSIAVSTQALCTSGATTNTSWIHITSTPPAGGGNVVFDVDKNIESARTGSITVTGQSFSQTVTVNQNGK